LVHVAKEGDDLGIGALVAKIDTSTVKTANGAAPAPAAPKAEPEKTEAKSAETMPSPAAGHPSPAAAKILRESDVSTSDVKGTGKDGRITKEDAQQAVEVKKSAPASAPAAVPAAPPAVRPPVVSTNFSRESSRKKMSRMRRTIAKRLVSAKNETAMLTTFNEVDLTEVMNLRKKYQDRFVAKHGIKLGFMSIFAKACAKVLMEMPDVNAMIDGEDIIYHNYVDISIAISTPNGLVVPPVHNVESLSLADIEWKIKDLADKARNGTLS
jgi:2-oxoglutarate dehydrogenase E2 component (dihydrolipoamide succinyltransferase)